MVNQIIKYSLSRIFIGFIAIIILSGFVFESTRAKYGSYTDNFEGNPIISDEYKDEIDEIYGTDNEIMERVNFWIDMITSSIPFALLDFFSFGILFFQIF